jgi:hypothetical protein
MSISHDGLNNNLFCPKVERRTSWRKYYVIYVINKIIISLGIIELMFHVLWNLYWIYAITLKNNKT